MGMGTFFETFVMLFVCFCFLGGLYGFYIYMDSFQSSCPLAFMSGPTRPHAKEACSALLCSALFKVACSKSCFRLLGFLAADNPHWRKKHSVFDWQRGVAMWDSGGRHVVCCIKGVGSSIG